MRALPVITLLAALVLPSVTFAEIQTITVTHTYILGDHDSKDDARQRCLLEAKRKVLEQAGVYVESASEVKNFDLTKDKITTFAAAVMQVKDTKEEVGFQQGHMTLTLTITAQVDHAEVRKLPTQQADNGVQEDLAVQKDRLHRLEVQLEAMQQQMQQAPGRTPAPQTHDISAADVQNLRTRAAQEDARAQLALGMLYYMGLGVAQDYATARQWFERAAAQGHAQAQTFLGLTYVLGRGVPQDDATARQWFERAAAQGHAQAQSLLGLAYAQGRGVPQDYVQARYWLEKAAVQGDAYAQYNLGVMYDLGHGVPQDYTIARRWYEQAAAQGYSEAQSNLGALYDLGHGVPQDYTAARRWYEQAATQGNARAQYNLGGLYFQGSGGPQDIAKARQWWERAAAQGDADAQGFLGLLYAGGLGGPQDNVRAYMWVNLAVEQYQQQDMRRVKLEKRRDAIAKQMTPAQVAEGQKMAREWKQRSSQQ